MNTIKIHEPSFVYENHQYHSPDGTELLSVTDVVKTGLGIYQYKRANAAAEKGTQIHKALQYFDEDDLNEDNLDPIIKPYLEQYKLAKQEKGIVRIQNEIRRYSPKYLFAGCIDLICKIDGKYSIMDFKTGKKESVSWKWQLAAYEELMKEEIGPMDRYALHLSDTNYNLIKYEEENNFREFLSLMVVTEIKKRNGY